MWNRNETGIGVGISSGANFLGALKVQNDMRKAAVVVTVLPDDNKKYLSTDLLRDEPVKEGFLSPDVQLLGFRAFNRFAATLQHVVLTADGIAFLTAAHIHVRKLS